MRTDVKGFLCQRINELQAIYGGAIRQGRVVRSIVAGRTVYELV